MRTVCDSGAEISAVRLAMAEFLGMEAPEWLRDRDEFIKCIPTTVVMDSKHVHDAAHKLAAF
eukprot:10938730-Alexandrium_andersonii.AAC.1